MLKIKIEKTDERKIVEDLRGMFESYCLPLAG